MGLTRLMKGEFHFSHDEGDQAFCRVRLTFIMDEEKRKKRNILHLSMDRKFF